MELTGVTILTVTKNTDNISVTITYNNTNPSDLDENGQAAVYTVQLPSDGAPNQDDITSSDNNDYYTSLIMGS